VAGTAWTLGGAKDIPSRTKKIGTVFGSRRLTPITFVARMFEIVSGTGADPGCRIRRILF